MKNQVKIDGQNRKQIFSTNFSKELFEHNIQKNERAQLLSKYFSSQKFFLVSIVLFLISISFASTIWLLSSAYSPISLGKNIITSRALLEEHEEAISHSHEEINQLLKDMENLRLKGSTDSISELASSYDLYKGKIKWSRIYLGIEDTIKNVVSANDIIKKIQIGSIIFKSSDKSVLLDRVRAVKTSGEDGKNQSSIVLATLLVDKLEQSPYIKDVTTDDYTKKQIASGGILQEEFTPLSIKGYLQYADEKDVRDSSLTITKELEDARTPSQQ